MLRLRRVFALGVLLVLPLACEQVLDIQDPQLDPCTDYCETVQANCTGEFEQYATFDVCLSTCQALAVGTEGVTDQNDVQCRMGQARAAGSGEANVHCPQAGPAGDTCGGDECASFCDLFFNVCPTLAGEAHENEGQCRDDCRAFTRVNGGLFTSNVLDGDNLECRWYHLESATLDAGTHCPHTAGISKCVGDSTFSGASSSTTTGAGGAGGSGGSGGDGGAGGSAGLGGAGS